MRPRGIAITTFLTHAAFVGFLLAQAAHAGADPIAEKALAAPQAAVAMPAAHPVTSLPRAAVPAALPAAALLPPDAPAPVADPAAEPAVAEPTEAQQRGDRTKIFSYILLRGLQGAGPFSGR